MLIQYVLLELLIGAVILGFIGAFRKRFIDRIILFISVPVSYLTAILLAKSELSTTLSDLALEYIPIPDTVPETAIDGIETLAVCFARPILVTVVFWVLLFLFRIIIGFVMLIVHTATGRRRQEKEEKRALKEWKRQRRGQKDKKAAGEKPKVGKPVWQGMLVGLIGAASGFVIFMLSLLPLGLLNNIAAPALEAALEEDMEGTYANEVAATANENFIPFREDGIFSKIRTYSGMAFITDATIASLTDAKITVSDDKEVEFNCIELLNTVTAAGVKATKIYETTLDGEFTFSDFKGAGDVVLVIAESEPILEIGAQMLTLIEEMPYSEDAPIPERLMAIVVNEYRTLDASALKRDLVAVATLVDLISEDFGDVSYDDENLVPELLEYLKDEKSTEKLVSTLAKTTVYGTAVPMLMETGIDLICEFMGLSEDRADDYRRMLDDVCADVNDNSNGEYDETLIETFIEHCVTTGSKVSDYGIANVNEMTELDHAYRSYIRFFGKMSRLEKTFENYHLDNEAGLCCFLSRDGVTVYYYVEVVDMWIKYDPESTEPLIPELEDIDIEPSDAALAATLLINATNSLTNVPDAALTSGEIADIARLLVLSIGDNEQFSGAAKILTTLYDESAFTPTSVYRCDIMAALNKDAIFTKEHDEQLASTITLLANLYSKFTEDGSEPSLEVVMENFTDVGVLLDSFANLSSTKNIPYQMLMVIKLNKDYRYLFAVPEVNEMFTALGKGEASYEDLFKKVKEVYEELEGAEGDGESPDAAPDNGGDTIPEGEEEKAE